MFTSIPVVAYAFVSVLFLLLFSYVAVKTFHYPDFNHESALRNSVEKVCFVIGTVITVILFSAFWIVSVPGIAIYYKFAK